MSFGACGHVRYSCSGPSGRPFPTSTMRPSVLISRWRSRVRAWPRFAQGPGGSLGRTTSANVLRLPVLSLIPIPSVWNEYCLYTPGRGVLCAQCSRTAYDSGENSRPILWRSVFPAGRRRATGGIPRGPADLDTSLNVTMLVSAGRTWPSAFVTIQPTW